LLPNLPLTEADSVNFELLSDPSLFNAHETIKVIAKFKDQKLFHYANLSDGSDFIRWTGSFDFIVSKDGHKINGRSLSDNSIESLQTYLLGQVLSFGMVRQGIEPLHATVVARKGQAVAFMGDCGYGKSTLAAAFLQAGFQILTDDMLIVRKDDLGYNAYPGLPRIKLYPHMAKALIRDAVSGTPMNPRTTKLIISLAKDHVVQGPTPLKMFYALQSPDQHNGKLTITHLSQGQALIAFVQNTFNTILRGTERLTQQFDKASELSTHVPVKSLSYPREMSMLPKVVDAVLKDIA
jgi:hypothetical protein